MRDYRIAATDNTEKSPEAERLAEKARRADHSLPEYNHGYPGELKMMLDMLVSHYASKPVGICGVSSGAWGGARMVEQLRLVCLALHMLPVGEAVYFPRVQELFGRRRSIYRQIAARAGREASLRVDNLCPGHACQPGEPGIRISKTRRGALENGQGMAGDPSSSRSFLRFVSIFARLRIKSSQKSECGIIVPDTLQVCVAHIHVF